MSLSGFYLGLYMADNSDCRLQGQEKYLHGVLLIRKDYQQNAKNDKWEHDHCEFCLAKFSVKSDNALKEAYATADEYHWVCMKCFEDFKEAFKWKVLDRTHRSEQ